MDLDAAREAAEGEGVLFARSKDLLLRAQNALERQLIEQAYTIVRQSLPKKTQAALDTVRKVPERSAKAKPARPSSRSRKA